MEFSNRGTEYVHTEEVDMFFLLRDLIHEFLKILFRRHIVWSHPFKRNSKELVSYSEQYFPSFFHESSTQFIIHLTMIRPPPPKTPKETNKMRITYGIISPPSSGECDLAAFSKTSRRRPVMYTLAPKIPPFTVRKPSFNATERKEETPPFFLPYL